jgi:hypothetical protein
MNEIRSNREANRIFSAWRKPRAIQRICSEIAFSGSHRAQKRRVTRGFAAISSL